MNHLRLDSLDVSGYRNDGILVGSWNGLSGYADVRITNCQVHANGEAGLCSYAFYPATGLAHHDWYVGGCTAYDNAGRADITNTHTGNGIVLSGIDGALVEKCVAYHNGWLNANQSGGPVGIWGWSCNNLIIQLCESHHNMSGTSKDGGGFDLDGGCTNSVLQYNYSHDNQGPGYLLAQFGGAPAMHDLTVRYNISENDARKYNQGAIELWSSGDNGGIVRANIYNNTVYLGATADGSAPSAAYITSDGITAVALRNNTLQTAPGLPVLISRTDAGVRLEGNCYWTPGAALQLLWNGTTYSSLSDWRTATSQETLDAGTRPTGLCADPSMSIFTTSSANSTLSTATAGYNPKPTSAVVGAGLRLTVEFGLNPGERDFFGNPTPANQVAGNIGASEARAAPLATAGAATPTAAWCTIFPTIVRDEVHVVTGQPAALVEVQLFDLMGRLCHQWQVPSGQLSADSPGLALPTLAAGQYVLQVGCGTRVQRQKLVVSR
ncbi:T9SS type A sorting domain-containing protein [Siccationidurans ginsengisoli]|uniref:T9SS type A sorting domain-containing protein n=1 Tax=Hymenobacter TaxID=89966 RepID=UPI001AACE03C|nr:MULTISPECIES: T9SS type A sorting domain-containing protein [unclassified Hymenobacter]MBO2029782.1 T9SS type A sorting domain-containing protein [Hymenobacter sp. BT559]